jgi:Uncharacterised nucleotidyltransferase
VAYPVAAEATGSRHLGFAALGRGYLGIVSATLIDTMKRAVAALEAERITYLLAGGMGCWAYGGPPSSKDIDLMVKTEDAERALRALEGAGMRAERPAEQWLFKAWDGDLMIDLIFDPIGLPITDEVIARGEQLGIGGMEVRVMALDDILATKLLAFDEHSLDYRPSLQIARALRERIDWARLRERVGHSPYARAFLCLVEELGIAPSAERDAAAARPARVRIAG